MLRIVPLSLFALLLYALAALLAYDHTDFMAEPGQVGLHPFWDQYALEALLPSGQVFALTYGTGLALIALAFLLLAVLRAAASAPSLAASMAAAVVLGVAVVAFLAVDEAGTTTFLVLTAILFVEAVAAISIAMFQKSQPPTDREPKSSAS